MGKVTINWLTTGHSGRACSADAVYTKINKQTGQVTSSKLCHNSFVRWRSLFAT